MPASGSPTVRRRELGARLRALRTDRGWTVEQVAERLRVSSSKVSRLENGLRGVSARDIEDLCDFYDLHGQPRQQLVDLAAEGRRPSRWQSRDLPYARYAGLESAATSISDFGLGVIPGLLQTPDYAHAVLTAIFPPLGPEVIAQRLDGRIRRQRLLTADTRPTFEAIIDEGVLHRVGGSRAIMRDQLQHLLTVAVLPNVTIRVLPYQAGILPAPNAKFIVLSFEPAAVPGVVYIEGIPGVTSDSYLGPQDGLAEYSQAFSVMRSMAATAEESRRIISKISEDMII